ncbi:unnamed protein product [Paramecium sonneborni]|uniref:Cyclic nucleotide-binding domain-containing protein n=1 Tax=Paramecium sonneborni TaxID=65129 RepID=A0A8S1N0A1_9CILI|nr:unnamed protein product [Paramecium sonneborni]
MQEIKSILQSETRSHDQIQELEEYFYKHFDYIRNLKSKLDANLYLMLFEQIRYEKYPPLTPIFEAGDIGRRMYFIIEGTVGIFKPKNADAKPHPGNYHNFQEITDRRYFQYQFVNILKAGTYFGEVALHQKGPRNASVCSITKLELAVITYDTYQKILSLSGQQQNDYKFNFLKQISLFEGWKDSALLVMLMNCEEQYYTPFTYIFKYNQPIDYVYFIVNGDVKLKVFRRIDQQAEFKNQINKIDGITHLTTNQYFGDMELYYDDDSIPKFRNSEAQTQSSCKLLKICAQQFIDNYRLFSTISKPKAISQKQQYHRCSMQKIRDKVISQKLNLQIIKVQDPPKPVEDIIFQPIIPQIPIRFKVKFGQVQSQDYLSQRSLLSNDLLNPSRLRQSVGYIPMKCVDSTFINCAKQIKISKKSPLRKRTYSIK